MIVLTLPKLSPELRALFDDESESAAVLSAPCSRARETLLAWVVNRALRTQRTCAWLSCRVRADRALLERWGAEVPNLVVSSSRGLADMPVHRVEHVVIADAESADDPRVWLAQSATGMVRTIGTLSPRGHWWRDVTDRARRVHRFAAGLCPPDEVSRARIGLSESQFSAEYLLEDLDRVERAVRFNVFSRERLQIRDKEGMVIPFHCTALQRSYLAQKAVHTRRLRALGMPVKFLLLKYRRGGFTTTEQGLSYQMCASRSNMQAITLAHRDKSTTQIFRIAQLMHRKDPRAPRLKGSGNARQLEFPDLNSLFFIGTAGASGEGRGDTFQRVHGSEVSKWGKGPSRHAAVRDLVAGLAEAASHGEVVFETTPNGMDWFADTYRAAKAKQNDWVPLFLPWFADATLRMREGAYDPVEIRDTLTDRERQLMTVGRLSLAQVAWRRMKIKSVGSLFIQEYPEDDVSCFLTTGASYFTASTILDLLDEAPTYDVKQIGEYGYRVEWVQPVSGIDYVIGCDTSEGVAGKGEGEWFSGTGASDPCGFGVLRVDTGEQVAAVHGIFDPAELAVLARETALKYNEALLGVERNNHGHAVLGKLLTPGDTYYHNLYFAEDDRPGWLTSPLTRPVMIADLREAVEDGHMGIRDRQFLQECLLFVKQFNGKWEGSPDDCVIKWAIAWQMRDKLPHTSLIEINL